MSNTTETNEEIVLNDNQLTCALTDAIKPAKSKELTLQSLIAMLNEEYGFEMTDMERKPANDSLVRTFKHCHDYIYGNEGMKKTAFW